jgi:DNA invertase Pin-like site-specific DNA recombinase
MQVSMQLIHNMRTFKRTGKQQQKPPDEPEGLLFGYARVSTEDQILDTQVEALKRAGVPLGNIYSEHASGAKKNRKAMGKVLRALRSGDTLFVTALDRFGRDMLWVLTTAKRLDEQGVRLRTLNGSFDTSTPAGRAMLQLQAVFAEFERAMTVERTKESIAAHKERGGRMGRKRTFDLDAAKDMLRTGLTVAEVAKKLGIKYQALRNHVPSKDAERLARLGPLKRKS